MASPQFNKKRDVNRWFILTYQSNDLLNDKTHGQIKQMISELLVGRLSIQEIHSYLHGTIIFSIPNTNATLKFSEIVEILKEPLAKYTPKLLFVLALSTLSNDAPPYHYLYIDGSDEMDINFLESIKEFYPKK